jgi:hypothetical protein
MAKTQGETADVAPAKKTYQDYSSVRHYDDAYRLTNLGLASPEQVAKWRLSKDEGGLGLLPPLPEVA